MSAKLFLALVPDSFAPTLDLPIPVYYRRNTLDHDPAARQRINT